MGNQAAAKRRKNGTTGTGRRKSGASAPADPSEKENQTPPRPRPRPKPKAAYNKAPHTDPEIQNVQSDAEIEEIQQPEMSAAQTLVSFAGGQNRDANKPSRAPALRFKLPAPRAIDKALGISEEEGKELDEFENGGEDDQSEQEGKLSHLHTRTS